MISLERILNDIGVGRYHALQIACVGALFSVDGAEMITCATVLTSVQRMWHLSDYERACMMSIVFVGMTFGGLVGGRLGDVMGRRPVVLLSMLFMPFFSVLSASAHSPQTFLLARFFVGFSVGHGLSVSLALCLETTHVEAGRYVAVFTNTFFSVGEMYASSLFSMFMPTLIDVQDHAWREVIILTALPSAVMLPIAWLILQESPAFFLSKKQNVEALEALKFIAAFNRCDDRLLTELSLADASQLLTDEATVLMQANTPSHGTFTQPFEEPDVEAKPDLLSEDAEQISTIHPHFYKVIVAGAFLCAVCNAQSYGLSYLAPQLLIEIQISLSPSTELCFMAISGVLGMLVSFLLLRLDLYDRDRLIIVAAVNAIIFVVLSHALDVKLELTFLCLSKICSGASFILTYVILGNIFPCNFRCLAMSICIAGGRVGSVGAPLLVEFCRHGSSRTSEYFLVCAGMSIASLLAIRFCIEDYDVEKDLESIKAASVATDESKRDKYQVRRESIVVRRRYRTVVIPTRL
eukprot:TRINITY_DN23271_c0_g1_i1.p1 TRINITY_DN23271_c0_g1~~TRINITY_DN23271_c0_g1_i1.p1  ORF type:complete len:522 (+),score=63.63 TRINITY_DN23271_c0_g1_i1:76-1641(+)